MLLLNHPCKVQQPCLAQSPASSLSQARHAVSLGNKLAPKPLACGTVVMPSMQASINELEVVIDESNAQISSLREQLNAAQERLDTSEADGGTLQATVASLQQEVQAAQVGLWNYPSANTTIANSNDDNSNIVLLYK